MTALVVRAGQPVLASGDVREPHPVASVSKQFVAAAIGLLVNRGLAAYDEPVGPRGATVHQLLTHTAGLGHWDAVGGWESFAALSRTARLDAIRASAPVEGWSYSGLGYLLLASLVEERAGVAYGQFARTELLEPAGMSATTSGGPGLRSLPGTGDMVSTVEDLCRWPVARPQVTVDLGTGAFETPVSTAHAYGYGVYVGTIGGRPAIFHPGDNPGHQSLLAHIPSTGTTLALLVPDDTTRLSDAVRPLLDHLG